MSHFLPISSFFHTVEGRGRSSRTILLKYQSGTTTQKQVISSLMNECAENKLSQGVVQPARRIKPPACGSSVTHQEGGGNKRIPDLVPGGGFWLEEPFRLKP